MKTSTIIFSLLSAIAMVAASPINTSTHTTEDSMVVLTGTPTFSPSVPTMTTMTTMGTVVRRDAALEPTHTSQLDCPYVCNLGCWVEGGCTPEAFSKWQDEVAASHASKWTSMLLEHWSSTHVAAKPTVDADGMSISWRTAEPTYTGLA